MPDTWIDKLWRARDAVDGEWKRAADLAVLKPTKRNLQDAAIASAHRAGFLEAQRIVSDALQEGHIET